jgi:hypothetical protein
VWDEDDALLPFLLSELECLPGLSAAAFGAIMGLSLAHPWRAARYSKEEKR